MVSTNEKDQVGMQLLDVRGWNRLSGHEKTVLQKESTALLEAAQQVGKGRLAMGKHLSRIRDVLESKSLFSHYLKSELLRPLGISKATAYRYIGNYEAARTILPVPVMELAMLRGMDKIDVQVVTAHPPPRSKDAKAIGSYLDRVQEQTKQQAHEDADPDAAADTMMKECYNFVRLRFEKLPSDHRRRAGWMHALCGMQLTMLGVGNVTQIEPRAIPDDFRANPMGRPRKLA